MNGSGDDFFERYLSRFLVLLLDMKPFKVLVVQSLIKPTNVRASETHGDVV